jgi:hypothetical protein
MAAQILSGLALFYIAFLAIAGGLEHLQSSPSTIGAKKFRLFIDGMISKLHKFTVDIAVFFIFIMVVRLLYSIAIGGLL